MDMQTLTQSWTNLLHTLDIRLFHLGQADVTLAALLKLVLMLALLFWGAAWLRRWLIEHGLKRLNLDEGNRQAIGSVLRYLVVLLGMALILQNAGIDLTALGVVAGAVGVGVGFGLQNIVSNFISGLIVMLERPIKVGDRIEVGGVEGTVREISARRTTVVTRDNITLLMPNQRFIVDNVVNLTHLGEAVRLRIPVSVAADTDFTQVRQRLLEVARQHDAVLETPPPQVLVTAQNATSLSLELAVWHDPQGPVRAQLTSDLLVAIGQSLRAHEIRRT